jgi:hypothetical protein
LADAGVRLLTFGNEITQLSTVFTSLATEAAARLRERGRP